MRPVSMLEGSLRVMWAVQKRMCVRVVLKLEGIELACQMGCHTLSKEVGGTLVSVDEIAIVPDKPSEQV